MARAGLHPMLRSGVTAPVDLARLPARPVRLILPPTGSVRARCPGVEADVELTAEPGDKEGRMPSDLTFQGKLTEPLVAGETLFPFVGLGLRLHALVRPWPWHPGWPRFEGPTRPGEEVLVEIPLGDPIPVLRVSGRAVDEQGQPFRNRFLHCGFRFLGATTGRFSSDLARTDGEGLFTFHGPALTGQWQGPADYRELEIVALGNGGPEWYAAARGRGPRSNCSPFPLDGRLDLGRVVLAERLPLLAGQVRDTRGRAVAGIRVSLTPLEPPSGKPAAYFPVRESVTDAQGRFRFSGTLSGWLQVKVVPGDFFLACPERVAAAGTLDLEFVLRGAGAIEGSLCLDPDVPKGALRVCVAPDAVTAVPQFAPPVLGSDNQVDREGRFTLRRVRPGARTVRIQVGDRLLAEVPQVVVREGEVTRDERLNGLDLTSRLRWLTLSLVDGEGQFIDSTVLRVGEFLIGGGMGEVAC